MQPQAHFAANSSRAFLLSLCTSAHPWGYGSQDSDPGQQDTLSAHQVRSALHDDYHWPQQPHEAHYQRPRPKDTWPHKAGAPVPLAWLLQCAEAAHSAQDIWPALRTRLEQHFALERLHAQHWARKAHALLLPAQATPCATLHDLAQALHAVAHMRIVALSVAPEALARGTRQESLRDAQMDGDSENNDASASDQRIANVEHLLQRLNAGGTELRGDELLYSMIKAYWPGIETTIDQLPRRPPATQVALLGTRAALSSTSEGKPRGALSMRVCQQWGNTIGNLHILRFEENRSRQDRPATDSIADAHLELAWLRDGTRDLRPAFSLEHDDVRGGSAQRAQKVQAFVCAARARLLRMYEEWYG